MGAIFIELANNSEDEIKTREQLLALLKRYDLRKWIFTERVQIDQRAAPPRSHPGLTLNTRHPNDDSLLLATFIHEQLHWCAAMHKPQTEAAIAALRALYPKVPTRPPEGARDERSTYLHLIICYLEYRALLELLGPAETERVLDFWSKDHYTWIYKTVRTDADRLGALVQRHGLMPGPRDPARSKS